MRLVLELVSPQSQTIASAPGYVVGDEPILIGRDSHCDWIFNDRYVSGEHAQVRFFNGLFFVEAIGRNPIAIDDPEQKVPRGKSQSLRAGCRLFIDEHELNVTIRDDDLLIPGPQRPRDVFTPPAPPRSEVMPDPRHSEHVFPSPSQSVNLPQVGSDVMDQFQRAAALPPQEPSHAGTEPSPECPDDDWHKDTTARSQATVAMPEPEGGQHAPAPRPSGAGEIAGLLRGAGLDPDQVDLSPEVAHQLGQILRIIVAGTMDVLHARAEIKEQFRLPGTRVQRKDNNPLKFSADVDDALHNLLVKRSDAYLPPVEAFESAFEEIRRHQLAMLHGLRVAFDQLMRRLDPKRLADEVEKQGKAGLLAGSARARCWDAYEAMLRDIGKAPDDRFRQLFGDAFGRAYEDQLARLGSVRRKPDRERKA